MRVKTTLLNPTNYCANFRLVDEKGLIIGRSLNAKNLLILYEIKHILIHLSEMVNNTILEPFSISKNENTEFERGIYKIFVTLFAHEDGACTIDPKLECESDYIRKPCEPMVESKEDFRLLDVGSVWTFMVTANKTHCSPKYARDLAPNEISILWLLPEWRKVIRIMTLFFKM